jgi:hypothetical protein
MFSMFKIKYPRFPWFDFPHFWQSSRKIYKLEICWNDPGDPPAVFEIFAIEATIVNSTFAKIASNNLERICAIKDYIFNEFL